MKPILILQLRPEDETSDNEYAAFLKYGELKEQYTHRIRIEKNGIPSVNLEHYSAIIVGGSPLDISTPSQDKEPIQHKIEADFSKLFDEVVKQDFPFLGACSGNGLLGAYLGANISRKYPEPVSSAMVTLTKAGKQDALLAGFPEQIKVLLGHKEACDETPQGATLLIQGEACPVQMFRVGRNVYATQFHPEGDPQGFAVRINTYKHHGYFAADKADKLIEQLSSAHTPYAHEILKRFVERYLQV